MVQNIGPLLGRLLPFLLQGALVTLELIAISIPAGLVIGVLVAAGRLYGNRVLSLACRGFTAFFRSVPGLVILFLLYYGLPSINIFLSPFLAACIGFSLGSGAYHSEYIRGAIQSIQSGQMLAARSIGMSKFQAIWSIILPQALRRAIPGCSNEIIYLIKYSSLAFMVTCIELTGAAKIFAGRHFVYTETFVVVGAIYLLLVFLVGKALSLLEKKLRIPGLEQGK